MSEEADNTPQRRPVWVDTTSPFMAFTVADMTEASGKAKKLIRFRDAMTLAQTRHVSALETDSPRDDRSLPILLLVSILFGLRACVEVHGPWLIPTYSVRWPIAVGWSVVVVTLLRLTLAGSRPSVCAFGFGLLLLASGSLGFVTLNKWHNEALAIVWSALGAWLIFHSRRIRHLEKAVDAAAEGAERGGNDTANQPPMSALPPA
jgi:hypothetical protein